MDNLALSLSFIFTGLVVDCSLKFIAVVYAVIILLMFLISRFPAILPVTSVDAACTGVNGMSITAINITAKIVLNLFFIGNPSSSS